VAVIAVIGLVYRLKLVIVTTLFSILLAFVLEPFVSRLARIGIPRGAGALLAVILMVGLAGGLTYFFYSRAIDFATHLPKSSGKIRSALADLRAQTSKIEEGTRSVIADPSAGKPPLAVEVREASFITSYIGRQGDAGKGFAGDQFHSFPGVLYADLEGSCAFLYRAPVPEGASFDRLPHCWQNIDDDSQLHCWQCSGWPGQRCDQYHRLLAPRHSVFLFSRRDKRVCQLDSLPSLLNSPELRFVCEEVRSNVDRGKSGPGQSVNVSGGGTVSWGRGIWGTQRKERRSRRRVRKQRIGTSAVD
jgi:hypothetical protein